MEKTIRKFFKAWQKGKYSKMYPLTQLTWQSNNSVEALKTMLEPFRVEEFDIMDKWEIGQVSGDVKVFGKKNDEVAVYKVRLLKEEAPMQPSQKGRWGVNPVSILKTREGVYQVSLVRHARRKRV